MNSNKVIALIQKARTSLTKDANTSVDALLQDACIAAIDYNEMVKALEWAITFVTDLRYPEQKEKKETILKLLAKAKQS